jgi:hypothetical protein
MLFVLACVLAATTLIVLTVVGRAADQGCRYRCTCVRDSVALGALASITTNVEPGHDR